jgi:hypothetical protein
LGQGDIRALNGGGLQGHVFSHVINPGRDGDDFDVGPDFLDFGDLCDSTHAGHEDVDNR